MVASCRNTMQPKAVRLAGHGVGAPKSGTLGGAYHGAMTRSWLYATVAVGLVLFGIVGLFSIGAPFLLTGLAMLLCFPWRRRREVLWSALAGVWGLTIGYILVAPLGCTSSASRAAGGVLSEGGTTCNGLLLDYSGGPSYNAPLLPALLVGLASAAASALLVRMFVTRRRRTHVGS